jgi:hypothetical protein
MDTTIPSATPADYLGLKTELQNIAGIIEQYPDHLKQRTFELLITAYLGSAHSKESTPPMAPEVQAAENLSVEAASNLVGGERAGESEFSTSTDEPAVEADASDLETRINANIESSTNMLRRRIRLRSMSPMRWQTPA